MMQFSTVEARWFLEGSLPKAVGDWIGGLAGAHTFSEERDDHYLVQDSDALGIKVRGGLIEVKYRVGRSERIRFGDRASARIEPWTKWSFPLEQGPGAVEGDDWVTVAKQRTVVRFESDFGFRAEGGLCALEVGVVRLPHGEPWWTMCFEAVGEAEQGYAGLKATGRQLLATFPGPVLPLADSYGYPSWLLKRRRAAQAGAGIA